MPCSCPVFWIDENVTALIFGNFGYISNSFEQLEDNVYDISFENMVLYWCAVAPHPMLPWKWLNMWEKQIPNPGKFKYTLINTGSCFHLVLPTMTTQPQQKLAASDTQALCKFLFSKNVDILSNWRVHKCPHSWNCLFPTRCLPSAALPNMLWSLFLFPPPMRDNSSLITIKL